MLKIPELFANDPFIAEQAALIVELERIYETVVRQAHQAFCDQLAKNQSDFPIPGTPKSKFRLPPYPVFATELIAAAVKEANLRRARDPAMPYDAWIRLLDERLRDIATRAAHPS